MTITWELDAFGRIWPRTSPESVQAHLDVDQGAIYFTSSADGTYPWSAIAREMTCAVAPHESIGAISPGLRMVLEAKTFEDAFGQAEELGITGIQELGNLSNQGTQPTWTMMISRSIATKTVSGPPRMEMYPMTAVSTRRLIAPLMHIGITHQFPSHKSCTRSRRSLRQGRVNGRCFCLREARRP